MSEVQTGGSYGAHESACCIVFYKQEAALRLHSNLPAPEEPPVCSNPQSARIYRLRRSLLFVAIRNPTELPAP